MALSLSDRYIGLMKRLLPPGKLWVVESGTVMEKLFRGFSDEFVRIHSRTLDLITEADPRTATESLTDWERIVQIPDSCQGVQSEIGARRSDVVRKLAARGGQSAAFYIALAAQFGYTVTVENYIAFRAGKGRAGDELWAENALFSFKVKAAASVPIAFAAGQSSAGDPLRRFRNDVLECVITRAAPAHTHVVFSYGS